MIAICLSYAPSDLNEMLSFTPIKQVGGLSTGGGLAFSGLFFFILPLFPLLIWIGADENASLNTLNLDLSFSRSAKNPYPGPAPIVTQSTTVMMDRL